MAYHTIEDGPWPKGTTVTAWPEGSVVGGIPTGAPISSGVASANGVVELGALTEGATYVAFGHGGTQTFDAINQEARLEAIEAGVTGYVVPTGLVDDGSTSNLAAIIDALTRGRSTKRPVFIPPPTVGYAIDDALLLQIGDRISGGRWEDSYLIQTTDNMPIFRCAADNVHSLVIENLRGTWARQQTVNEPRAAFVEYAPPASSALGGYYFHKYRNLKIEKASMAFATHDTGAGDAIPVWGCHWQDIWTAALGVGFAYLASAGSVGRPSNKFTQLQCLQRCATLTTLTAPASTGATTLTVGDTSRMAAAGTATAKTAGQQPIPFTYTGKTSTTLTGVVGITIDLASGAEVGMMPGTFIEGIASMYFSGLEVENWCDRIMYSSSGNFSVYGFHVEHHMVTTSGVRIFEGGSGRFDLLDGDVSVRSNLLGVSASIIHGGAFARISARNVNPSHIPAAGSLALVSGTAAKYIAVEGQGGSPPGLTNDIAGAAGSTRIAVDTGTAQSIWTVDGNPPRLDSTQALPAAAQAFRGRKFVKEYSIGGVAVNTLVECRLLDNNAYAWVLLEGGYVTQTVTTAAAITMDALQGKVQRLNLQANAGAITITNAYEGAELELRFVQDGTGSRTYALPTGIRLTAAWTASTLPNREDVLVIRYDGAAWRETDRALNVGAVTS